MDGLYSKLGEYENLDELNYLASKLDEMDQSDYAKFQSAMEIGDYTSSLQEIINLTENLDCYEIYPNIEDYDDLGRYYLEELEVSKVPAHLQNYIDYEAYGRDVALEENGTFTDQGYVWDTRETFHKYYDGERGSIPDEYRVMTFPKKKNPSGLWISPLTWMNFSVRTIRSTRRSTRRHTPQRKNCMKI